MATSGSWARVGILGLWIGVGGAQATHAQEMVDGIAAQVGSEIVLYSEVMQVAGPVIDRMRADGADPSQEELIRAEVLERLIERALIRQVVKRAELEGTDAEVDEAIASIAAENGLTLENVRESVESKGVPYEVYRERIRGEIEQSKVVNGMIASRVRVDEKDVKALYRDEFSDQPTGGEQCSFRLLMIGFDGDTAEARASACGRIGAARARVLAGEPLVEVGAEYQSTYGATANDVSGVHTSEIAPWIEEALGDLESGDLTEVIETPQSCALIEILERRDYVPISYDDAREALRARLFDQKMGEEYAEFLEDVREQTYIERKGTFADRVPTSSQDS